MNKHTPGPWKVDDSIKQGANYTANVWQIVAIDPVKKWPHTIATIEEYQECPGQSDYIEGNAKLIAAAPEMREILNIIVAEFESDPMSTQCFDLRVVQRAIDIIKATK